MSREIEPFVQNAESPHLEQAEEGVAIIIKPMMSKPPVMMLHGMCRASEETASILTDTILHNVAIICTYGQNLIPIAFPLIRDQVVFPDDVQKENDCYTAYFNVNISDSGIPSGQGQYYILASFHTYLSEVVEFKLSDDHD